jgi:2-ketoarginine methyltransferase
VTAVDRPVPPLPSATPEIPADFERQLVSALQPVRNWALAQCLYHLFDTGIYAALADVEPATVGNLSMRLGMDADRLDGFLTYLCNEGYLTRSPDGVARSAKGVALAPFEPWYTLLIGGYTHIFQQAGAKLIAGSGFADRDGSRVGVGSCGISRYDAIPLACRLLEKLPREARTVVDIGCGDGRYLIQLCQAEPDLVGVGVDPDPETVDLGRKLVAEHGLSGRIEMAQGRLGGQMQLPLPAAPDCFITAFVLQELLEQEGEPAVIDALRGLARRFPEAHLVVIEVDHQPDDPAAMSHGLGLAYYNPYYLIHRLTEQRLETTAYWDSLFVAAGFRVVARETTDPSVDSTGLELGYLLAPV